MEEKDSRRPLIINRRELFKYGGAALAGSVGLLRAAEVSGQTCTGACPVPPPACSGAITEVFPASPLILEPWSDQLPVPTALAPVPASEYSAWATPPNPLTGGQQDSDGVVHQVGTNALGLPNPFVYK